MSVGHHVRHYIECGFDQTAAFELSLMVTVFTLDALPAAALLWNQDFQQTENQSDKTVLVRVERKIVKVSREAALMIRLFFDYPDNDSSFLPFFVA